MIGNKMEIWCQIATRLIRFSPDRKAVYKELLAHMEDHRDALMAAGHSEAEAEKAAADAMGNPWVVAPELAKVHRPFWAYAHRLTRIAAIVLCLAALLKIGLYVGNIVNYVNDPLDYMNDSPNLLHLSTHDLTVYKEGYWFCNPKVWINRSDDGSDLYIYLYSIQLPWLEPFQGTDAFWITDDQGNRYEDYPGDLDPERPRLYTQTESYIDGASGHYFQITYLPSADIQWLELHYDREGRDLVLRLDLTGGDLHE